MSKEAFAKSVKKGLSSKSKHLSSRYFYDDKGSQLFKKIMGLDEYYLTGAEYEILSQQAADIHKQSPFQNHFNIVELGAGDGKKTIEYLRYLVSSDINFTYIPIDISQEANDMLIDNVERSLGKIDIKPMTGDYFDMLDSLKQNNRPNMVLFLGSNIGNYSMDDASQLLGNISSSLSKGDTVLIGVDLQKNPNIIAKAYNDAKGITRAFNLNLLERINRELGGNFNMEYWDFYSFYNPKNGEVNSFLISLKTQEVWIEELKMNFQFQNNEVIYTELSRKYTENEIKTLCTSNGLDVIRFFKDKKEYFTDVLLQKK